MRKRSNINLFICTSLLLTVAACGNVGQHGSTDSSLQYGSVQSTPLVDKNGNDGDGCPDAPNVTPDHDWTLNGSMYFTACTFPNAYPQVLIKGHANTTGNRICTFPMLKVDDYHILPKIDPSSGHTWYRCAYGSDSGVIFAFEKIAFNYVIVVEEKNVLKMQQCLETGRYSDCPARSPNTFSRGELPRQI